ncbi:MULTISPECIES: glycosyltransferase family 4 protein [Aequorivita]|uniref:Glycosyltransferase family 4 protein n=1 Tax=Aequorivita iocasae TaxID=2803865 RepID=A0ABX7DTF0_9FLAO|nr:MULTISPECIES: glycosyltransferase family 4 protein [Aequorivita]QQX76787.1 glycosyltransferase family 4 protein [Aequorivita iocasae]UCA56259.1 glycosyltransferase family 4 protein [Aequorivita sp. F7]
MSKSLKIIIFDGSFKTTPFINRLVKGLVLKHEVFILGFNEKLATPIAGVHYVSLGSNQNKFNFVITTLKLRLLSGNLKNIISAFKKLLKGKKQELQQENLNLVLHKINPDIIHLQWPSVIPWFEEVLMEQKIPVVLSQRGFHSNVRPFVDEANFEYLNKWYPKIAGFHSVSKAIAANGNRIWNAPKKIDHIIYTGLNLDEIPFSKNYNRSNPLKILSIGRAHWIKGYDYALQSCKILLEKGVPFQYTIIGGAGDEELQFLVDNLGLKNYVYLEKQKPQSEVFSLMQETSLLLMPSLEEGIPNVVVEAMAIGLPVISTNCGGVVDLISTEKEGWIVPIREPQAMAEAIEAFVNLPLLKIEEVRLAARKKVEQQHNEEQMVKGMEELYYELRS